MALLKQAAKKSTGGKAPEKVQLILSMIITDPHTGPNPRDASPSEKKYSIAFSYGSGAQIRIDFHADTAEK